MSKVLPDRVLKSILSQTKKHIAKQKRFIEQWAPVLETLRTKEPAEAVELTIAYIESKVSAVQQVLDTNQAELVRLQELLQEPTSLTD